MTKYAPYTASEAVARAKSYVGKYAFSGMCQAFTVTMFGTGAVGDYDGDRDADAVDGWRKAVANGRVVHARDINDYSKIPAGVALYWSGGSRGFGHASVSIGNGQMVTTDYSGGRVGIANIRGWWPRSHTFLGYAIVEGNGHMLLDPPPPRKPSTVRVGTWNVDLKVPLPAKELDNRVRRIRRRVKQFRLDVLAVQECPSSGQGKRLFGKLIGRDRKPMKRVGSHGRYIFHTARARDVEWTSFEVEGKRVTVAAMTISGIRRGFIDAHPIGGSSESIQNRRTRYAEKVWAKATPWFKRQRVDLEDAMYLGDHNGSEAGTVGRRHGFIRARGVASWKTALTRTYNAMGRRKPTHPGGQFDYMLIHQSKRKTVQRYRNVHTPHASDHNLVVAQVKE